MVIWGLLWAMGVWAYLPMQPTNDTSDLVAQSNDFIQLSWRIGGSNGSKGVRRDTVSRQLVADNSTQVGSNYAARGALVHFSENNATQQPTNSPFVAFIQCDTNVTNYPADNDVFTEVRDLGAVAALVYSLTSATCQFNPEYLQDYDKPLDVYATTNLQSARLINSQFDNVGRYAHWYNSTALNASTSSIWAQLNDTVSILSSVAPAEDSSATTASLDVATSFEIPASTPTDNTDGGSAASTSDDFPNYFTKRDAPTRVLQARQRTASATAAPTASAPTFLIAVLANVDATFSNGDNDSGNTSNGTSTNSNSNSDDGNGGRGGMTSLAMIVLYSITAVVTILFLVVIITGAIKAIRHPERYGPRAGTARRAGQTRARGMTRAILDTFPVVKFGHTEDLPDAAETKNAGDVPMHDLEAAPDAETRETPRTAAADHVMEDAPHVKTASDSAHLPDADPLDVDDELTCPICLQSFESGEDLRVLPCDARHRFHRDCIDPWLLGQSSLCPLCRLDLGGGSSDADSLEDGQRPQPASGLAARARRLLHSSTGQPLDAEGDGTAEGNTQNRFLRYLALTRERRRRPASTASPQVGEGDDLGATMHG